RGPDSGRTGAAVALDLGREGLELRTPGDLHPGLPEQLERRRGGQRDEDTITLGAALAPAGLAVGEPVDPGPPVRPDRVSLHRALRRRPGADVEDQAGSAALAPEHPGQGSELRSLADDRRRVPDEQAPR